MTMFLSVFVTVMVALGTTAPVGSVTLPRMLPVISWAEMMNEPTNSMVSRINKLLARMLPPEIDFLVHF
jgi:hypothetical protein